MDTKKKEQDEMKRKVVTHLTILVIVVGLIITAYLLANSGFNFVDFLIKVHGG